MPKHITTPFLDFQTFRHPYTAANANVGGLANRTTTSKKRQAFSTFLLSHAGLSHTCQQSLHNRPWAL